ncbi:hypothetical protein KC845_03815 [Candidatus Kaiserbacteria bacterium]|nr:hypothetical protein [Candidatus Kaiserbacteria bacterium]
MNEMSKQFFPEPSRETAVSEVPKSSRYAHILEEAYLYGGLPHLPELEVFSAGEINTEAISEFLLELVDFIERKEQEADEEELENLYRFGQGIHSEFFSASPSLINHIRLPDRLKLMTRATRSKVVQGTFGSVFVGETVYDVSFMKGNLYDVAVKAMEDLSIPEKLDLLHQLRTVGAQAIANGEWSRPAYNQVRQTYESLAHSVDIPVFVQLAAEAGLEALDTEYKNPQLGVIRFEGQTSDSRLNTRFSNKQSKAITDKFFSKYSLDHVVSNSTRILPATKDALVYRDRSGLAAGIIRMDVEQFLDSPKSDLNFDVNQYRIYKQHFDAAEQFPAQRRDKIQVKIYHAIYNEHVGELVASGDAEGAAKVFAEMLPVLSEEEWKTYFIGEIKQREYPSQNELYHKAGDENGRVSHDFVTGLFDYRDQLGERYEEDYMELEAALEHDDFEYAFECASIICRRANLEYITYKKNLNLEIAKLWADFEVELRLDVVQGLEVDEVVEREKMRRVIEQRVQEYETMQSRLSEEDFDLLRRLAVAEDELHQIHQKNFETARQKFEAAMLELGQTKEMQARAEVVRKIENNLDELGDELRAFIEEKLATIEDLPQLELTTLKELVAELKGDESMERVTDEDVLLFQHVHSGELAGKIENEFGFTLSDLSLREQYFFLNYLKRVTPSSAELMKRFTSLYGVDGMRTFLSLEQLGPEFGEYIVNTGNFLKEFGAEHHGEVIFGHFADLQDDINQLPETLSEQLAVTDNIETQELLKEIQEGARRRAAQFLHEIIMGPLGNSSESYQKISDAIKKYQRDAVTLTSTFRTLFQHNQIGLEEMKGLSFETLSSDQLSAEDITEMERLYRENYQEERYQNGFIEAIINKFHHTLEDAEYQQNTRWYMLRHEGKPIGFCKFTDQFDEEGALVSKHFGGFNVNQSYGGGKLGEAMLQQIIEEESYDDAPIIAECIPETRISSKYIDETGFDAVGSEILQGIRLLNIVRDANSVNEIDKQLSKEEAVYLAREVTDGDDFMELSQGQKATRYFYYNNKRYAVFRDRGYAQLAA